MIQSGRNPAKLVSVTAGGVAGGIEAAVTYPLEFAKTRAQLSQTAAKRLPQNPLQAIRFILRDEGLSAMYRGCSTLVVGSIGKDAIRFLAFDSLKKSFADPSSRVLSPTGNVLTGMTAGLIASTLIVTPSERIKTALIDDARTVRQYRSPFQAVQITLRKDGLRGLYRGYVGTTLKQTSATAFRFGSYNILQDSSRKHGIGQGAGLSFVTGGLAGLITTLATQPFDVVKTRSQSLGGCSTTSAVRGVLSDDGVHGFWKGTTMRLGRTVVSGAILFTVYENIVNILELEKSQNA